MSDFVAFETVANQFAADGRFVSAIPYGEGHINDTYAAYFVQEDQSTKRYILQRINSKIFLRPDLLMDNITVVTAHIAAKIQADGGDSTRETLTVIPTHEGKSYVVDARGNYWRMYIFIEQTVSYQLIENPEHFYKSAIAFGRFQKQLADFDATVLHETIPNFHNTAVRFETFRKAVEEDAFGRAAGVQAEIDFAMKRAGEASLLVDMLARGELQLRVTHNDTKLNNVLIDEKSGNGICVIDLDTVMPGLALYDYGDSIRFGASTGAEDETDLTKVTMSLELFGLFTKGFLEQVGTSLTENEIDMLPWGAKLMTFECGVRFLTDHLCGDTYFKIHRDGHNLDRCRTQFKLVADMEQKWDEMNRIVQENK